MLTRRAPYWPVLLMALVTTLSLLWLGAAPAQAAGELAKALEAREKFMGAAAQQKSRANWIKLIDQFEEAAKVQPHKGPAARARYHAADLSLTSGRKFKQSKDFKRAETLARQAVRGCPTCSDAPAAQLIIGEALKETGQLDQAYAQLMKVELNYPKSPEVEKARTAMAKLRPGGGRPPVPDEAKPDTKAEAKPEVKAEKTPDPKPEKKPDTKTAAADPPKKADPPKAEVKPIKKAPVKKAAAAVPPKPKARADGRAQLYHIEVDDNGDYVTVTAYLDKVTNYVYNMLPPPREGGSFRVYVDFKSGLMAPSLKTSMKVGGPLVRLVKASQMNSDVVRLVVDLSAAHPYTPTFKDNPPRMVINVAKDGRSLPPAGAEAQPEPEDPPVKTADKKGGAKGGPKSGDDDKGGAKGGAKEPVAKGGDQSSLARQLGLKIKTVVIDPGHGGRDGGAVGNGLKEKDITLKVAKQLAAKIEKRTGLKVYLTRDSDVFLSLEKRTQFAKDKKADIFISIHVNANDSSKVEGYETYILNFATDKSAMAVAARENASVNKNISEMNDILKRIAKNTKVAESRILAKVLHSSALKNLRTKNKVRDLGIKEAPFFVLVGADVPSVLVEIGFISHSQEAQRLTEADYINRLTDGLCQGVINYHKGF